MVVMIDFVMCFLLLLLSSVQAFPAGLLLQFPIATYYSRLLSLQIVWPPSESGTSSPSVRPPSFATTPTSTAG
jgi:hypothetical protein